MGLRATVDVGPMKKTPSTLPSEHQLLRRCCHSLSPILYLKLNHRWLSPLHSLSPFLLKQGE
ncbi:hypothetical protein Hanom_Chr12g01160381 [Helianthus anomalus]